MTADIAAFLTARLDEEAETARAASLRSADWFVEEGRAETWDSPHRDPAIIAGGKPIVTEDAEYSRGGAVEHIARQDPEATLDRVAATKAVVAIHRRTAGFMRNMCGGCSGDTPETEQAWPCPTLRALASAYRRHPNYDQAWLPDGVTAGA